MDNDLNEWLSGEEIPDILWNQVKMCDLHSELFDLLSCIREKLFALYGNEKDMANSFADSRFTPLPEMIDRHMASCGALVNIFGNVLRKLGIPARFVHGKLSNRPGEDERHAWLEIFDSKERKWIQADPTTKDFKLSLAAVASKTYHDWEELKIDYENGAY